MDRAGSSVAETAPLPSESHARASTAACCALRPRALSALRVAAAVFGGEAADGAAAGAGEGRLQGGQGCREGDGGQRQGTTGATEDER